MAPYKVIIARLFQTELNDELVKFRLARVYNPCRAARHGSKTRATQDIHTLDGHPYNGSFLAVAR